MAQAETQIVQSEATLKQAQNAFARTEQLRKTGTASVETYEQREMEALVAASKVKEAQQALALARADKALAEAQKRDQMWRLARAEIRAPASGVVSRRAARLGAVVAAAGDPLFRIIEDGSIELEAEVAETTLARLAVGQPAEVVPAGHDEAVEGRIRLISPEINPTSRLGRVRIALEPKPGLSVGAFAYGTIETAQTEGVLIPLSAVLYEGDRVEVQVVEDGVVRTRAVKVGLVAQGVAEIESGVAAGDRVWRSPAPSCATATG
jgi:HlyD family secretion protein